VAFDKNRLATEVFIKGDVINFSAVKANGKVTTAEIKLIGRTNKMTKIK
jgi:hypothetical protein